MADDTNQPSDDISTDQDPQSAMAAQGLQALGKVAEEKVLPAIDKNLQGYNDMVQNAIAGDKQAQNDLIQHHMNLAMGSIQNIGGPSRPMIFTTEQAAESPAGLGAIQRAAQKVGMPETTDPALLAKAVDLGTATGKTTQKDLAMAMQRANRPGYKTGYAKGGEVNLTPSPPKIPVAKLLPDASPINLDQEPPGIDEFLSGQPAAAPQAEPTQEPPGINDFIGEEMKQEKYGTPGQMLKTAAEGAAQGLAGPLAPAIEQQLGVKSQDILARQEANPLSHFGGEAAGLIAPALLTGGAAPLAKATVGGALEAVGSKIGMLAGESLASKVGATAARTAVENMLLTGSDEASKMILNDPATSTETALSAIGLSGVIGGALGGAAGALSPLWKAKAGNSVSQMVEDFSGRMKMHMDNPDPVVTVSKELGDFHAGIKDIADEVYGPTGLKAQDIAKSMPKMSGKIGIQSEELAHKVNFVVDNMVKNPDSYPPRLTKKILADYNKFKDVVFSENPSSADIFNASQDLKQTLQGYSKFDKFVKPVDEAYDFVKDSKDLAHSIRTSLEDTDVWGTAAKRQQAINNAFTEYLPSLKDFEKKFTTEVLGERVIDPGKVGTYLNQLGKPNAEIKQQMLENFLDASKKYKAVIEQSHMNLGMESPITHSPLNYTMSTFDKPTTGAKLADAFIKKGLTESGGKGAGAVVGGTIGHMLGHGGIGALIGTHTLGPFFNSVLPAIAGAVLRTTGSAEGFKAATDYGLNVAKGSDLLGKAAKNVFREGSEVLAQSWKPTDKDREKLKSNILKVQENPNELFGSQDKLQHYMPNHSTALNSTVGNAIEYLNSLRSSTDKKSPLDSTPVLSAPQKASYNTALDIAQQPLVILDKVKNGTISVQDIVHLSNLYPSLYKSMQQKLMNNLIDAKDKGTDIPYKTRLGLSLFMAQPLDSTMTPQSIMAAQMSQTGVKQAAAQQQQAPGKAPSSSKAPLNKMPGLYSTGAQSRESHRQQKG